MAVRLNEDEVLVRFRRAVEQTYGAQVERLVLFGSRARGEGRPDSDYDVGVFLHGLKDFDREARTLAEIETDILTATGAVVHALPLAAGSHRDRTGLMQELRRDGRDL